jgi:hypothetical protein
MSRTARPSRSRAGAPHLAPGPLPDAVAELQTRLRLAQAQNAYLHRELATALRHGPLAPDSLASDADVLQAENRDLRARLTLLTLHYDEVQRSRELFKLQVESAHKELKQWMDTALGSGRRPEQTSFVATPPDLAHVLTTLLKLAHPDLWSQGQPATELAHEITVALNRLREEACS